MTKHNYQCRIQILLLTGFQIFYILEFLIDYLKQDADKQYFCDAEIIVKNSTDFDPKTVCSENAFLPLILEWQHIRHLSLILQLFDLEFHEERFSMISL